MPARRRWPDRQSPRRSAAGAGGARRPARLPARDLPRAARPSAARPSRTAARLAGARPDDAHEPRAARRRSAASARGSLLACSTHRARRWAAARLRALAARAALEPRRRSARRLDAVEALVERRPSCAPTLRAALARHGRPRASASAAIGARDRRAARPRAARRGARRRVGALRDRLAARDAARSARSPRGLDPLPGGRHAASPRRSSTSRRRHARRAGHPRRRCTPRSTSCATLARDGKGWIVALEAASAQRTGIASLKVRYNRVFGYYIEVTKANLGARAGRLRAQADARRRRALRHRRAEGARAQARSAPRSGSRQLEAELFAELVAEVARARSATLGANAARAREPRRARGARRGRAPIAATCGPALDARRRASSSATAATRWSRRSLGEALRAERLHARRRREQILLITGPEHGAASRRTSARSR